MLSFFGFKLLGDAFGFNVCRFGRSFFELVDGSGNVDKVLFACKEGVAVRTDFNMNLRFGGTGDEGVATGTDHLGVFMVLWVEVIFHSPKRIA